MRRAAGLVEMVMVAFSTGGRVEAPVFLLCAVRRKFSANGSGWIGGGWDARGLTCSGGFGLEGMGGLVFW